MLSGRCSASASALPFATWSVGGFATGAGSAIVIPYHNTSKASSPSNFPPTTAPSSSPPTTPSSSRSSCDCGCMLWPLNNCPLVMRTSQPGSRLENSTLSPRVRTIVTTGGPRMLWLPEPGGGLLRVSHDRVDVTVGGPCSAGLAQRWDCCETPQFVPLLRW